MKFLIEIVFSKFLEKDFLKNYLERWEQQVNNTPWLSKDEKKRLLLSNQTILGWKITGNNYILAIAWFGSENRNLLNIFRNMVKESYPKRIMHLYAFVLLRPQNYRYSVRRFHWRCFHLLFIQQYTLMYSCLVCCPCDRTGKGCSF